MEVDNEIVYNFFMDMRKKDIHPVDRGNLIKRYCEENNISYRKFANEIGMPHSTIQDWVDYARLTKKQYGKLIEGNHSKKEIHKLMRNTRTEKIDFSNELNLTIKECIIKLKPFINNPTKDENTGQLIHDLQNVINRLELHIEKVIK